MNKILLAFATLIVLAACSQKPTATTDTGNKGDISGIAFEVAKNYFFKNNQEIPSSPKITTAEEFGKLFGMATTMGEDVSGSRGGEVRPLEDVSGLRGGKVRLREDVSGLREGEVRPLEDVFWVARRRRKQISGRFLLEYASNWIIFCTFAAATRLIW